MIQEVAYINANGGFDMHSWSSNNKTALLSIPRDQHDSNDVNLGLNDSSLKTEKALGLHWATEQDVFFFNVGLAKLTTDILNGTRRPTKREFLRIIMSIYDPLGFLAPFVILSKILMQDVWLSGIDWDEMLGDNEHDSWYYWIKELPSLRFCSVPRCYLPKNKRAVYTQLHLFCDASSKAYSAVAYWRYTLQDGTVHISLIGSKSRVAPLKPISIPRLELQAALLASRFSKAILSEHTIKIDRCVYWSDSRTVLLWIKSDPRQYQTFVSHRLGEIVELTNPADWRWIPTDLNPADDATKRTSMPLHANVRWFSGPSFLSTDETIWPEQTCVNSVVDQNSDRFEGKKAYVTVVTRGPATYVPKPERFSKWKRLLRSTDMFLVAVERWMRKKVYKTEVEHLEMAENMLIGKIQSDCFCDEMNASKNGKAISTSSRLKSLTPVTQKDGLLHVQGRVSDQIEFSFNVRPPILDGKHPITRLIVGYFHEKSNHSSTNTVLNEIRQRYWIIGLRNTLRTISAACQFCKVAKGKPSITRMADLPSARLGYRLRPFSNCGLDYFGPVIARIGRRREKRWVALFTCLTVRAIHLELVHTANTDSAIMAIRRMIARRGQPITLYSDNGRNFVGANNELLEIQKELNFENQREFLTNLGTKWIFIPPDAPHTGGAWERLVLSVKKAWTITLKCQEPEEEVLVTPLLAEVTRALFTRFEAAASCTRKQYRVAQAFADSFWKRWLREYLPNLLPRSKWTDDNVQLKVGDVVIVVEYGAPRNTWTKALVERVIPGADNRIRVAEIRIGKKTLLRPSCKLIKIA